MLRKLWFVRHKHTKLYFPSPTGRSGRGGSHTEATSTGSNARIFMTERSAKIFLSTWVKGKFTADRYFDPGHPGNDWEADYGENISVKYQPNRLIEDYEIISVEINL